MNMRQNSINAFLLLLRVGLWGNEARLLPYKYSLKEIYELATEQSVVGIVAAGLEHISDLALPKQDLFSFVGDTLQLEQRNTAMNIFIGALVEQLTTAGIYSILVKGQGVAQCYEKPLWRACGDVDLLFDQENYEKAKCYLIPLAESQEQEDRYFKHVAMTISSWEVELHGTLRSGLWNRVEKGLEKIKDILFNEKKVRVWNNNGTKVLLPSVNEDIILIFSHILQHFFSEGIGLRQICDWCRLLWSYKDTIDIQLLECRLHSMGVMTEWKAFAAFVVKYLGMPSNAIPFYSSEKKWRRAADIMLDIIIETGNFGHNRDYSYYKRYPYVIRKVISFGKHSKDRIRLFSVFPLDSTKLWLRMVFTGVKKVFKDTIN